MIRCHPKLRKNVDYDQTPYEPVLAIHFMILGFLMTFGTQMINLKKCSVFWKEQRTYKN